MHLSRVSYQAVRRDSATGRLRTGGHSGRHCGVQYFATVRDRLRQFPILQSDNFKFSRNSLLIGVHFSVGNISCEVKRKS
jgi:hypothetical protein